MQLLLLTFAGGHIIIYQSNTVTMVWGPPVGGPPGPNEFGMPPHRFRPAHSRRGMPPTTGALPEEKELFRPVLLWSTKVPQGESPVH